MREAVAELGGDPAKINPLSPAEMVIDHSVIADVFGPPAPSSATSSRVRAQPRALPVPALGPDGAFDDFKVVPPGTGIVHQVNIEHLAPRVIFPRVVRRLAYPDTCVGTDSHTTMVNGLGVLGWGVGGIEAEAAMLGQPVSMLIPRVVGFKLTGQAETTGVTATDLVLTITDMLRKHGVVGKFVEFYGEGVAEVPLANRATIGNMSPEFGSTCAIFPIDDKTLDYLRLTGRSRAADRARRGLRQGAGLWHDPSRRAAFSEYLELDLSTVVPSIAGPKRPQDRVVLSESGPRRRHFARCCRRSTSRTRRRRRGDHADLHPGRPASTRDGRCTRPLADGPRRSTMGNGAVTHRLDHLVHQHVQPVGDDRPRRCWRRRPSRRG
jgi:aconitate hydratase